MEPIKKNIMHQIDELPKEELNKFVYFLESCEDLNLALSEVIEVLELVRSSHVLSKSLEREML